MRTLQAVVCGVVPLFLLISVAAAQSSPSDFTVIALPDTQFYSQDYPNIFLSQTQWIANAVQKEKNGVAAGENGEWLNIQFVVGLGDIVNNGSSTTQQQNADAAIDVLDAAGIPYALALGNHDYENAVPSSRSTINYNKFFGVPRYTVPGYWWYLGHYGSTNENFYTTLVVDEGRASEKRYLVLVLEFYPRNAVLDWAKSIVAQFADHEVILITHSYLISSRRVGLCDSGNAEDYKMGADNDGQEMWNKFVRLYPNMMLVTNGHYHGQARRADLGDNGNLVNQILVDYQAWTNGGNGYLRIMTFQPAQNQIVVKTYSPSLGAYLRDSANQFTLTMHNTGQTATTGAIAGRVRGFNDCAVLSGVTVRYEGGSTVTDSSGYYTLSGVAPGSHTVTVDSASWTAPSQTALVHAGFSEQVDFFPTPAGAPVVAMDSPGDGDSVTSPVQILASATSESSTVTAMKVYVDDALAYSVSGDHINTSLNMSQAAHRVTAQAWDAKGLVGKKHAYITVTATPPKGSVTITAPTNNSTVKNPVTVQATATSSGGPITTMRLYVDYAPIHDSQGPSFTYTTDMALGWRTIAVNAWDSTGAVFVSTISANVEAANSRPSVTLNVTPTSGQAPLQVSASASGSDVDGNLQKTTIDFGDGAVISGTTSVSGSHTYSAAGNYTVLATAVDSLGLSASTSAAVNVTPANSPPTVSLNVSPTSGPAPLQVSATATGSDPDGSIVKTTLDFGNGVVVDASSYTYTYTNPGNYTVRATVIDNLGASASTATGVTVTNPPPTGSVTIWSPSPNQIIYGSKVYVKASAQSPAGIKFMQVFIDGRKVQQVQGSTVETTEKAAVGEHLITVRARDKADQTYEASVNVTVNP